jgi:hypothetical protein
LEGISINLKKYSVDINLVVDVNSVVYKFSGVYENTVVDKNSVGARFKGVDYCTWSQIYNCQDG